MSDDTAQKAQRIAARGPEALVELLRPAYERQAARRSIVLEPSQLESLIAQSVIRADGVLWRRALAGLAVEELGIDLSEAVDHPAVEQAQALAGAPPYARPDGSPPAGSGPAAPPSGAPAPSLSPAPAAPPGSPRQRAGAYASADPVPEAVRVLAVHVRGIETLRAGDRDLELRFANTGVDVLVRSTGASIGRLAWEEIESIEMSQARRGLIPSRRRPVELAIRTDQGQARFELPGLAEAELREQLAPYLARTRTALRTG
jgi:hypothetical protein